VRQLDEPVNAAVPLASTTRPRSAAAARTVLQPSELILRTKPASNTCRARLTTSQRASFMNLMSQSIELPILKVGTLISDASTRRSGRRPCSASVYAV